jgi:hypothetical protein
MHDVNPLSTVMYLRELDCQAAPQVRAMPSRRRDISGSGTMSTALVVFLRGFHVVISGRVARRYVCRSDREARPNLLQA